MGAHQFVWSRTGVADNGKIPRMTTTPAYDLTGWFTKQDAATALGVTKKTIERALKAGKLTQRFRPNPGSPPVGVFSPEDVMALKAERTVPEPQPRVLPASPNGNGEETPVAFRLGEIANRLTTARDVQHTATILSVFEPFFEKVLSRTSPTVSTTAKWLTVDEAAVYLGWPTRDVRHAIKSGELPPSALKHTIRNGWRIRRSDLDSL